VIRAFHVISTGTVRDPYATAESLFPRRQGFPTAALLDSSAPESSAPEEQAETVTYGYIIAKPEIRNSNSNRRVCFVYTVLNDTFRKGGNNI
jgi:hypothetical protein